MSLSLQQLEVFDAVARNRSFSAAARDLYLSQSHVSGQIRRLEEHVRVPLFIRSQPKVTLTEAGAALHERVQAVLEQLAEIDAAMGTFREVPGGTIRVGAVDSAGNFLLPRVVAEFRRACPQVTVEVRIGNTREVHEWLEAGTIEVGVCPALPGSAGFVGRRCFRESLVVITPAGWVLPDPLDLEAFARAPKVVREEGSYTLAVVRDLLADIRIDARIAAQVTGNTAVAEAVAAGVGIALIPRSSAQPWIAAGAVRLSSLAGVELSNDFHLIHRAGRLLEPASAAFLSSFPNETSAVAPADDRPSAGSLSRHALASLAASA